jgi:hypothetical protein
MTRVLLISTLACFSLAAACAPAPLYTASKLQKGAATWGEIPRDARGEPVWTAIGPVPTPAADVRQAPASARSTQPEAAPEGDAEESPKPPKA